MKNKLLCAALIGVFATSARAAIPAKTSVNPKALEILSLPSENRAQVIGNTGTDYYKDYIAIAFAEDQSMRLRWRALMRAAETHGEKSTEDLLKASVHKQWFMRNASLIAMAEFNPSEAQRLAKKLIKDKALVVRSAAVEILQKSVRPETRDLLWQELAQSYNFRKNESLWIRSQIVEALSEKPADTEMIQFTKLINDKDQRVQSAAVLGMEKLTGVKLGENKTPRNKLVLLWQDYIRKENKL